MTTVLRVSERPAVIAFGFVILLVVLGGLYNPQFLSAVYLLQQLQVASFLGIIASGLMIVILLGQIDLSMPWLMTIGGMTATAAAGWWGQDLAWLGLFVAILSGGLIGLANGLGVSFLRIPSMVFTLGMNAVVTFWFAYVLTRPLGASFADYMDYPKARAGLGLPHVLVWGSLAAAMIILTALLAVSERRSRDRSAGSSYAYA